MSEKPDSSASSRSSAFGAGMASAGQIAQPLASTPQSMTNFGRPDSNYRVLDIEVQIDNQETIAQLTYDQMAPLLSIDPDVSRDEFVRMWKTIILKRAQDIVYLQSAAPAPDTINLAKTILMPAPLADLLDRMGYFHSARLGFMFHLVPPVKPTKPKKSKDKEKKEKEDEEVEIPDWWRVNNDITRRWMIYMGRVKRLYEVRGFPARVTGRDKPMMLVTRSDQLQPTPAGDLTVKQVTDEPSVEDALIFAMHDPIYAPHAVFSYVNSAITRTGEFNLPDLQDAYVNAYVLDTRA